MPVRENHLAPAATGVLRLPAAGAALLRRVARLGPSRGRLLLAAACVCALPLGYWAARVGPFFTVRSITVEGAPPALSRQVRAALAPIQGTSLLALDGDEVTARVEALPQVAEATYDRSFPETLVVRIRREVGWAVLRQGQRSWLLSARGRVVRRLPKGTLGKLPRIWVKPTVAVRAGSRLADPAALRSVQAVASLHEVPLPLAVHSVDARGPLVFHLGRGIELRLGDTLDLPLKLAVAGRVLRILAPPEPGQQVFLDVSVPERPVVGSTLESKVEVEG